MSEAAFLILLKFLQLINEFILLHHAPIAQLDRATVF